MRASAIGDAGLPLVPRVGSGSVELVKWVGVVLMLFEHYFRYAVGALPVQIYSAGRLVFPLFVFAFAVAIRFRAWADYPILLRRLAVWALVAQVAMHFVAPGVLPLNVLFTFAAGLAFVYLLACSRSVFTFAVGVALAALVAWVSHFGIIGAVMVAAWVTLARATRPTLGLWAVAICALVALVIPNGNHWALAALPLMWAATRLGLEVPRTRGAFYWVYALQFPAFALLGQVLS